MSKLTKWFGAKQRPWVRGWYEVRCRHGMYGGRAAYPNGERLWFDGNQWVWAWDGQQGYQCSFGHSCDSWRGLKSKSGAGEKG